MSLQYLKAVRILTCFYQGVFYKTAKQQSESQNGHIVPGRKVKVVDTTAAGDTFAGAYTVAVAHWRAMAGGAAFDLDAAISHANRAASMTVQKAGAQSSIPWADEVPES
jgi:ribokinase